MLFGSYAGSSTDKMGGAGSAEVLRTWWVGLGMQELLKHIHPAHTFYDVMTLHSMRKHNKYA